MKKSIRTINISMLVLSAALICGCGDNKPAPPPAPGTTDNQLPKDAQNLCPLPEATFNNWFAGGKAKENGFVFPANSVTFVSNHTNCSFYEWSEQMFLWITSPASGGAYGGNNTVLESPAFYTVEPEVNGERHFIAHEPGLPIRAMAAISQRGVNNLPIVHDKTGRAFELDTVTETQHLKSRVLSVTGNEVNIARAEPDASGKLKFFDKANKEIVSPKVDVSNFKHPEHVVRKLVISGRQVFLSNSGPVDIESGQAYQGDALMSQSGGMVYYIIFANDVYAWFQYAYVNKLIPEPTFPTDSQSRNIICSVAHKNGVTLHDSNALAMEIKTSWIETQYVKDSNNYVNINAVIPEYKKTDSLWSLTAKEKTVRLSMVGMHIVGSTNKHPEMIWATYEYKKNTPNETYQYIDSSGAVKTAPRSDTKDWLFCNTPNQTMPEDSFNIAHMKVQNNNIVSVKPYTISPSNSLLLYAYGSSTVTPNPLVTSAAMSNSQVISSNNAILKMLPGNDKRKNYILIGAEWTDGAAPNGNAYPADSSAGSAIGTSVLANSTMETTIQLGFTVNAGCFNCHQGSLDPSAKNDLSHIFSYFPNVLPPIPKALQK